MKNRECRDEIRQWFNAAEETYHHGLRERRQRMITADYFQQIKREYLEAKAAFEAMRREEATHWHRRPPLPHQGGDGQ